MCNQYASPKVDLGFCGTEALNLAKRSYHRAAADLTPDHAKNSFVLVTQWRTPMSVSPLAANSNETAAFYNERCSLAAAFRWTERLDLHEAVANHFSLTVNADGSQFLMNPNQMHFARIKASDMLLIDANDPTTMEQPGAPDPTAWGLHGAIHRAVPHARCVMHIHSPYATALAALKDSRLLPVDQNCAMFFDRYVIDDAYGGLAFEAEGERCAKHLADPKTQIMIMGNHGLLAIGKDTAQCFNRMFYFERACRTYILALSTGKELRVLSDEIAGKVADEVDSYPDQADRHLGELTAILDEEGSNFRD